MPRETLHEAIGKFIHAERKKQKLSLAQLSEKSFGNTHYAKRIMDIEKAQVNDYMIGTLDKILRGLNYDMKQLFK
jgi:transcriptional regulator with XRE-family HTH domain